MDDDPVEDEAREFRQRQRAIEQHTRRLQELIRLTEALIEDQTKLQARIWDLIHDVTTDR